MDFFLLGPRAIAPGTGPNSYEIAAGTSARAKPGHYCYCVDFFLVIFFFHLPDDFRFATSPATRRVAGHIIYQNVRLDRDRCAITFLNSLRIFRDVVAKNCAKILHVSQWDGRKKKSEKDQSLEFNKRLLLRHTFT